jgi:CheY-like chemotaxis protein
MDLPSWRSVASQCGALAVAGYRVHETSDGLEAVRQLHTLLEGGEQVVGILLDLTVPGGMGGLDALPRIRELDGSVPVFVTTGYAADPVLADPARYGFTDGIPKPFRREELHALLNRHLG